MEHNKDIANRYTAPDGSYLGSLAVAASLGEASRHHAEKLEYQATHDPLTGALNRLGLENHISKIGAPSAVLVIDANEIKAINDTSGHDSGDKAIKATYDLIRASVREDDVVARVGGDEFVVVLSTKEGIEGEHANTNSGKEHRNGQLTAQEIVESTKNRFTRVIDDFYSDGKNSDLKDKGFGLAVGGAVLKEGQTIEALLAAADVDMYRHKKALKDNRHFLE